MAFLIIILFQTYQNEMIKNMFERVPITIDNNCHKLQQNSKHRIIISKIQQNLIYFDFQYIKECHINLPSNTKTIFFQIQHLIQQIQFLHLLKDPTAVGDRPQNSKKIFY